MSRFRDAPIERKLVVATLVTTGIALVLAGFGEVLADAVFFRGSLHRDLTVIARIMADNSTATLQFDDAGAATEILAALHARPHVDAACIYREEDRKESHAFAQYAVAGFSCPVREELERIVSGRGALAVREPIVLDGRQIGTIVLFYDLGELNERLLRYGTTVFGVLLLSSVLAFILSSRLRAEIVMPVARLLDATTDVVRTGNYGVRAEKISNDELGVLVDRFNQMLSGIQSRDIELKAAFQRAEDERARFEFMAESMPQKIFTASPRGEVEYLNRQWVDFTGVTVEEIKNSGWDRYVHPDDVEVNLRAWQAAIETGEPITIQQRLLRADGNYRWHLSRAHAMRDARGAISLWIGSNTDIHEQKEIEDELRRANDDLQQFAYSASHDLQEPIRNVAIYSDIVARRYGHLLDSDGQRFLGFLREGGHRLSALVHDLLAYTRASMAEIGEQTADASEALSQALVTLAAPIRESGAVIEADALPTVGMGSLHLQQVLQNLIGNAVKYRAAEPPRIRISAERSGDVWRFSVQDNGIGIDPEFKEKIFGVFKRLSNDNRYSGTGIGLAICQRIVQRYGGRIWVESDLGKGAVFHFTAPRYGQSR